MTDTNGKEAELHLQATMSLRDWFAGLAMQTLVSNNPETIEKDIAELAYRQADAMIRKLEGDIAE